MKVKLREKYSEMSREQLLEQAYELGGKFEQYNQSCSQSTTAAIHEMLEIDDVVVKVATSNCGGHGGQCIGTCGALIGGTMILDYFFGRPVENMSSTECKQENLDPLFVGLGLAGELYHRFVKEYGTIICPHIQVQLYGRQYFMLDEDETAKMEAAGGHTYGPKSACHIVGNASRWVMEMLLDFNSPVFSR